MKTRICTFTILCLAMGVVSAAPKQKAIELTAVEQAVADRLKAEDPLANPRKLTQGKIARTGISATVRLSMTSGTLSAGVYTLQRA